MDKPLSIRLPVEVRKDLERWSKRTHRPKGDIVREALRRYLAVEVFRDARAQIAPHARAAGYLTDEDVFRDVS
jgi:predicted DNA-binding protein